MSAGRPDASAASRPRSPGVYFPPPLLFVLGFGAALLLNGRLEFLIDGDGASLVQETLGTFVAAAGFALMAAGLLTFARSGTAVLPMRGATRLVERGPYRWTRNPMYVGLTVAYLGLAVAMNLVWPLLLLPIVLWALVAFVIRREERYLRAEFGAVYDDYCRRVRRWI